MEKSVPKGEQNMSKKIAIVTGASSGFGLLCSVQLAKHDFQVIATMRNVKKSKVLLDTAKKHNLSDHITIHPLDVTSTVSINEFSSSLQQFPTVDLLVNNAGFALGGFSEEVSIDEFRLQFETNFFGVIAITQAILPIMRSQGSGRIINMSSISGKMGFPGLSPYVSSKHALEGYSESLRLELKPFGIDVVLVEPGSYQTNIWSNVDRIDLNAESPYHDFMKALMAEMESGKAKHGDPLEVAKLVAHIATQKNPPNLRYPIGKGVKLTISLKNSLPWKVLEKIILNKIFTKRIKK